MSIHRRAAKRDAVAKEIVATLRAHGCVVWEVSGTGIPDLMVLKNGRTWLADTKSKTGKATPAQEKKWEEAATKARVAVFILRTPKDAVAMLNSALPPWEPKRLSPGDNDHPAQHLARKCACYPSTAPVRGRHKPSTNSKLARDFYRDMRRDPVTGLPPAYYTPPRQPPGNPREAEVFAPPPASEPCARPGCGHLRDVHPVIFSGDNDQCADCSCRRYMPAPRTLGEAMMIEMLRPPGKGRA